MPFQKAYDYVTQKVIEADWMGHKRVHPPGDLCSCSGSEVFYPKGNKLSYQCSISASATVKGRKYCWRHKRMLDQGKTPLAFPPGPVTES